MKNYVFSVFTNGSKTEIGMGFGVFSDDLDISLSIRLLNTCTDFQVVILQQGEFDNFLFVVRLLLYVYVYRLPAIKTLNSSDLKSKGFDD